MSHSPLSSRRRFIATASLAALAAGGGWPRVFADDKSRPVAGERRSGNPILDGWYADPEAVIFGKTYWIYPTYSAPYDQQTFFDAFSSPDLVTWTKHPKVLDRSAVKWARRAMWAPSVVEK